MSLTTPLFEWHRNHGGRIVDFAGWMMPVQYESIVVEHQAVRGVAGLFDVSHMGRLRFDGLGAVALLDRLLTRSVASLPVGAVRYSLVTNEAGGILDDVLAYHLADAADNSYYLLVVNASNREKILAWISSQQGRAGGDAAADARVTDVTDDWAMIAVQGPRALELVTPDVETDPGALKYYEARETLIAGHGGIVSRTGYTGEDGVELMVGSQVAERVWQQLFERGEAWGVKAAGLGCRDTLRLEAAMPLYGHELDESIDPYTAGLAFAVDLDKNFIGRDRLAELAGAPRERVRVGLELEGRRPAREGYEIRRGDEVVGVTTSGTYSPTLERPIAMGYVVPAASDVGTALTVDIRGKSHAATVVKLPFYRRPRKAA